MSEFDHSSLTSGLESEKKSGISMNTFYSDYTLKWLIKLFFFYQKLTDYVKNDTDSYYDTMQIMNNYMCNEVFLEDLVEIIHCCLLKECYGRIQVLELELDITWFLILIIIYWLYDFGYFT